MHATSWEWSCPSCLDSIVRMHIWNVLVLHMSVWGLIGSGCTVSSLRMSCPCVTMSALVFYGVHVYALLLQVGELQIVVCRRFLALYWGCCLVVSGVVLVYPAGVGFGGLHLKYLNYLAEWLCAVLPVNLVPSQLHWQGFQ